MGLLTGFFITGLVSLGLVGLSSARKEIELEKKRVNTPCNFNEKITLTDFECIVEESTKKIKRVHGLSVEPPIIRGKVRSQSGLSDSNFTIDFNDFGHLTGKYWLTCDNHNAKIPSFLAENIKDRIVAFSCENNCNFNIQDNVELLKNSCNDDSPLYCPFCGKKSHTENANYCVYCGGKF